MIQGCVYGRRPGSLGLVIGGSILAGTAVPRRGRPKIADPFLGLSDRSRIVFSEIAPHAGFDDKSDPPLQTVPLSGKRDLLVEARMLFDPDDLREIVIGSDDPSIARVTGASTAGGGNPSMSQTSLRIRLHAIGKGTCRVAAVHRPTRRVLGRLLVSVLPPKLVKTELFVILSKDKEDGAVNVRRLPDPLKAISIVDRILGKQANIIVRPSSWDLTFLEIDRRFGKRISTDDAQIIQRAMKRKKDLKTPVGIVIVAKGGLGGKADRATLGFVVDRSDIIFIEEADADDAFGATLAHEIGHWLLDGAQRRDRHAEVYGRGKHHSDDKFDLMFPSSDQIGFRLRGKEIAVMQEAPI